jgi:hypothetical protein
LATILRYKKDLLDRILRHPYYHSLPTLIGGNACVVGVETR